MPGVMYSCFQMSFVQNYLAHKFAASLSEDLHTEVSVGGVDINILFDVILEDVKINDLHHKPIIDAGFMIVDINEIYLSEQGLSIDNIVLENAKIRLVRYKNEKDFNFKFIADYFSSNDTTTTKGQAWKIRIGSLTLINNTFLYQDENKSPLKNGIDYDNLSISSLNANFNNLYLCGDTVTMSIRNLSVNDRSGFILKELSADALLCSSGIDLENLKIITPKSNLALNLKFKYNEYNDFNDFINKVQMDALIKPSKLCINDLAFFAPDLFGMNDVVGISGEIKGKVSNIKAKRFQFIFGKGTYFNGDVNISGLPDINSSYMHFNISKFNTTQTDIASFNLPSSSGMKHLELPAEMVRLGNIGFKGAFTGFYNDFVAYGDFYSQQGSVSTDITLRKNKSSGQIEYDGNVNANNLNLGKILDIQDELGYVTLNTNIQGSGLDAETAEIKLNGTIGAIDIRNYHYTNIIIEGDLARKKFNGYMKVNDDNVKLDFTGMVDYSGALPVFNVDSKIDNLKLSKLHFLELSGDSLSSLSTELKLEFEGNNIDNIQGTIKAENTLYTYKGEKYALDDFYFVNTSDNAGNKTLKVKSDYFDADFAGNFMFKNLYKSSLKFMKEYLPSYSSWIKENVDSIPEQNFVYFIKMKNSLPVCKLLIPELYISPNTIIKGTYNTAQSLLDLNLTSAICRYNNYNIKDFFVSGKTKDSKIIINIGCQKIGLSDSVGLDNVTLKSVMENDSIRYNLTWDNNSDEIKNSADIKGSFIFAERPKMELKFIESEIVVNDTAWTMNSSNNIVINNNKVTVQDLVFSTKFQKLKIDGSVSEDPSEILHLNFENFNVSELDLLLNAKGIDIDGSLNGFVDVSNIFKAPNVISNITINNFYVNKDKLGKIELVTNWNNNDKAVLVNADVIYEGTVGSNNPISISGAFYPEREKDNFDVDISLTNFKLRLLERYLKGFCSSFKGYASGNLKLKGATNSPELSGGIFLMMKGMKIDYLNEVYSFADSVKITKNSFSFDHLVLSDAFNDTAICDGKIFHKNFNHFYLDIAIKPNKLQCLNTDASMNNLFYGKAWATGLINITGDVNNINMDIKARTEKGTHFYIPITSDEEISENDYIRFVHKKIFTDEVKKDNIDISGITLNFDLDVTPDADLQIIFDSKIGDIIKAKGNGSMRMEITTLGDFNMYGDYIIEEGDYLFTLQNVINKKFIIQKGSSLKWNGSPYDGTADITAIYPVKTFLKDLLGQGDNFSIDSSEVNNRIPVNCMLGMTDKIFNPTITFDIELPNSSDNVKTFVKRKTSTEQEMNRQVFSLLILNKFTNSDPNISSYVNEGLSTTSTELLSNQLSNWLSQISDKFDIGINYRPGTEITSEQVEVALSTQLLNDKLTIDGNVVSGGNQKSSNIVGDVNVEYKLTDRIRLKGFNKSNTVDLLNTGAAYTQGVGIFYRREFDSLYEFFLKKIK